MRRVQEIAWGGLALCLALGGCAAPRLDGDAGARQRDATAEADAVDPADGSRATDGADGDVAATDAGAILDAGPVGDLPLPDDASGIADAEAALDAAEPIDGNSTGDAPTNVDAQPSLRLSLAAPVAVAEQTDYAFAVTCAGGGGAPAVGLGAGDTCGGALEAGDPGLRYRVRTPAAALGTCAIGLVCQEGARRVETSAHVGLIAIGLEGEGRWRTIRALAYPGLQPRAIAIYLPAAYEQQPAARFGVLYMHDGQNIFAQRSTIPSWRVDETHDALVAAGEISPQIIVGVEHSDARVDEYTPVADLVQGGGRGDLYVDLLAEVLKPALDTRLRTRPEREHTSVAGSSLGGIISLHAFLRHPLVFGNVAALSPSLYWGDDALPRAFSAHPGPWPRRLWIDIGTGEAAETYLIGPYTVDRYRALRDVAIQRGLVLGQSLGYLEDPYAIHREHAWAARLDSVLRTLLGAPPEDAPLEALSTHVLHRGLVPDTSCDRTDLGVEVLRAGVRLTWPNSDALLSVQTPAVIALLDDGALGALAPGQGRVQVSLRGQEGEAQVQVLAPAAALLSLVAMVPGGLPAGEELFFASAINDPPWSGQAMQRLRPGVWVIDVELSDGQQVTYKYKRAQTWEAWQDGSYRPDRAARAAACQRPAVDEIAGWE